MSSERPRPSTPPPANSMQVLAADLLCRAAKVLIEQLATAKDWQPMLDLKRAVECYQEVRAGNAIKDASDPQAMSVAEWTEPVPSTLRTGEVSHG